VWRYGEIAAPVFGSRTAVTRGRTIEASTQRLSTEKSLHGVLANGTVETSSVLMLDRGRITAPTDPVE
jgi:hypothetical protein